MTDDALLLALDRRGGRAGAARRAAAAAQPVPPFDPAVVPVAAAGPAPGRRRWVVAAAALVAVVVAAAALVLADGDEDDGAPVDRPPAPDPTRPYLIDPAPEDLGPPYLVEPGRGAGGGSLGPPDRGGRTAATATVYGDGHPGLAVVVVEDGSTFEDGAGRTGPGVAQGLEPVDLGDGRTAWRTPEPAVDGTAHVLVQIDADTFARLSRAGSVGDDVVLDAARRVVIEGERATLPEAALPAGWEELGQVAGAHLTPDTGDDRWLTIYGDDPRAVVLVVGPGDELAGQARRFWGSSAEAVTVQGRPALLVARPSPEGGTGWVVSWRAGERIVDLLVETGDRERALALAERVRPASDDDLRAMADAAFADQLVEAESDDDGDVLGRGRFSDGRDWALIGRRSPGTNDQADLAVASTRTTTGCFPAPDHLEDVFPAEVCRGRTGEGGAFAYGLVGPSVVEVGIEDREEPGHFFEVARLPVLRGAELAGWAAELPDPDHRYRVVAYDADGAVLASDRLGP